MLSSKNLLSSSSSLNLRVSNFYREIQCYLYSTSRAQNRSRRRSGDSLYDTIAILGDPRVSVAPVLDQWIAKGNHTYKGEIQRVIKELMKYRRFKHALEISLWMTNKRHFPIAPIDVAMRLKLISKNFGLEKVDVYFNKIPESLRTFHVYLGLLNCYTVAKSVDQAESVMQKARELGFASTAIWYDLLLKMHYELGNKGKVRDLLMEMETKGIPHDHFTYSVCLSACAMASDVVGMDKILTMFESNLGAVVHWKTYIVAAKGYLAMNLLDKALVILNKLEQRLTASKDRTILFVFLSRLYTEAGKKDDVHRTWNTYKKKGKVVNKAYIGMLRSLMKFDDVEGAEKILEEWEASELQFDFRVPNFLIDAYCTNGRLDMAEALVAKGLSQGGDPLVKTWCHLAGGYLKKDQVPEAVEALKKAISVCPDAFAHQKSSLATCLEHLGKGECLEMVEELINSVRVEGISRDVSLILDVSNGG